MSNIDVQNIKNNLDRKIYKILGMSTKNYVGTYDFIVRQTINYEKKVNGKDTNKFITVISNVEGNYVDYINGKKKDLNNIKYGTRCVFINKNILITGAGSNPNSILIFLKLKVIIRILIYVVIISLFIYFSYITITKIT